MYNNILGDVMEVISKTRAVGGSIVATIPKELTRALGIKPNELIKLEVKKIKKSYFGKFKGVGPFTKEDEFDVL